MHISELEDVYPILQPRSAGEVTVTPFILEFSLKVSVFSPENRYSAGGDFLNFLYSSIVLLTF